MLKRTRREQLNVFLKSKSFGMATFKALPPATRSYRLCKAGPRFCRCETFIIIYMIPFRCQTASSLTSIGITFLLRLATCLRMKVT